MILYIRKLLIVLILFNTACKKLVEVNSPVTSITGVNVYANDATAAAILTAIYANMSSSNFSSGGLTSMSLFPGLSADELTLFTGVSNPAYIGYYTNALTNSNTSGADFWNNIYPIIFIVNSAIEGLANSTSLTPAVKQQLTGEAKFMRAFCYFYLVNLYGDVPLVTIADYAVNSVLPRTAKSQVWQQIITDLKDAQNLLGINYLDATLLSSTTERVRPTQGAAEAMLARAYLYTQKWDSAELQATTVINNASIYTLDTLNGVFLKNNPEAIWQLQPVNAGQNTPDALLFVLPASGPDVNFYSFYLDSFLVNSFEVGDLRKKNWTGSISASGTTYYYAYKYKALTNPPVNNIYPSPTEYSTILRLAEQYLIRAEARTEQGNITGANSALVDLNVIRNRAGLLNYSGATDQAYVLAAIKHERQVELFTEWGHRWLDIKRTNSVDQVMSVAARRKGKAWNTNWQWYPISLYELQHDPNLAQNSGY